MMQRPAAISTAVLSRVTACKANRANVTLAHGAFDSRRVSA
jgi:hypothetical protein